MSKKYIGKPCAYCGQASQTADHLFARSLFPIDMRADGIKLPACGDCNQKKSRLEHYLSAIAPFASANESIQVAMRDAFARRLAKDKVLEAELIAGLNTVGEGDDALHYTTLRDGYLQDYAGWLAKGLVAHHTGLVGGFTTRADIIPLESLSIVDDLIEENRSKFRVVEASRSSVVYRGALAKVNPRLSTWYVVLHDGFRVGDSRDPGKVSAVGFRAMTIPHGHSAQLSDAPLQWSKGRCSPLVWQARMHDMCLFFDTEGLPGASHGGAPCYAATPGRTVGPKGTAK